MGWRPQAGEQRQRVDRRQRDADHGEPGRQGVGPQGKKQNRQREACRRNDGKAALAPGEPLFGGREQREKTPMERREARIGKKESELESADDGRRRPKQDRKSTRLNSSH